MAKAEFLERAFSQQFDELIEARMEMIEKEIHQLRSQQAQMSTKDVPGTVIGEVVLFKKIMFIVQCDKMIARR